MRSTTQASDPSSRPKRVWLRRLLVVLLILLAASYGGALHPAGDSFAVIRMPLAMLCAALGWVIRRQAQRIALWVGMAGVLLPWAYGHLAPQPPRPQGPYALTLYQQNMLYSRTESADWLAAVRASGADVVTLQEVSKPNRALMAALEDLYPYQHLCPIGDRLGEAVLSRLPMVEGSQFCTKPDALAGVQIETEVGPIWVVALHIGWPWPFNQRIQLDKGVLPALRTVRGAPVILGGDFNSVAWQRSVRDVEEATGSHRIGALRPTFALTPLGVPIGIDHVLSFGTGRIEVMPGLGSDHNGVLAYLSLLPEG